MVGRKASTLVAGDDGTAGPAPSGPPVPAGADKGTAGAAPGCQGAGRARSCHGCGQGSG